ncbi:MAG: PAS domain S-box protein [Alphaproteobacteria bacterium]|nr:PAS domain S-box protein [Alphaproteobacteria bacterium]
MKKVKTAIDIQSLSKFNPKHQNNSLTSDWVKDILLPIVFLSAVSFAAFSVNYLLFHSIAEISSVLIGVMAFVVSRETRYFSKNISLALLSVGIGFAALLDFIHALAYEGMALLPVGGSNTATQLWVAARFIQAFFFLLAAISLFKPISLRTSGFAGTTYTVFVLHLIFTGNFPDGYIEGQGLTAFKIGTEYVVIGLLFMAGLTIYKHQEKLAPNIYFGLMAAAGAMILSEFAFTQYAGVFDFANAAGHILKIYAYWFLFLSLVKGTLRAPFNILARAATSYDSIPNPAIVVDRSGKIIQANRAAYTMANKSGQDLNGADAHTIFHNPALSRDDCALCSGWAGRHAELKVTVGIGNRFYNFNIAPFGEELELGTHVEVIQDVTEERRLAEERRELLSALEERVKELNALHQVGRLGDKLGFQPVHLLAEAATILPEAFLHSDKARVCITSDWGKAGAEREGKRYLSKPIVAAGKTVGKICVWYPDDVVVKGDLFLDEEEDFLATASIQIAAQLERIQTWQNEKKLGWLLDMLGKINRAIVHSPAPDAIIGKLFEALTQHKPFPVVLIVRNNPNEGNTDVLHHFGIQTKNGALEVPLAEIGKYLSQGIYPSDDKALINDLQSLPQKCLWRNYLHERNLRWQCILPLTEESRRWGHVILYAAHTSAFEPDQIRVLNEMAADVSFALGKSVADERANLSEHRFRGVFEHSPMPMLIISKASGAIRMMNQSLLDWLGYSSAELSDTNAWFEKVYQHAGERTNLLALWEKDTELARKSGHPVMSPEVCLTKKDGSNAFARGSVSVTGDDIIVAWMDLTAIRQSEEALRESEQRFRSMIEETVTAVFVQDANGIVYANPSFCQMTGFSRDALIGQPISNFLTIEPDHTLVDTDKAFTLLADGQVEELSLRFRRKDRQEIELEVKVRKILWDTGEAVIATVEDITERRSLERSLRHGHDLLHKLSAQVPGVIYQYQLFPDGRSCFPFASEGMEHIYEVAPEDVTEDASIVFSRLHPDDLEMVSEAINRSAADLTPWVQDYRVTLPKQGMRWRSGNAQPEKLKDGSILWHGFITDATDRKQIEEKLGQYVEQLESSMQQTLGAVARMVEARDPYTAGHEARVGEIAADIAKEMGWPENLCEGLKLTGLVHDIGKIAVPAEILVKPGQLTQIELDIVRTHAEAGYQILKDVAFPFPVADVIRQHHERLDGSGYPQGLKGDEILPEAKVIAIADVVESMASHRPYRPARGMEAALEEIQKGKGKIYDPEAVDALTRMVIDQGYKLPY